MFLRVGLLVALVVAISAPARADYVAIYDWNFTAFAGPCGAGPGCVGYVGGGLFESGTFTIEEQSDLLGFTGILSTQNTPNYALVASSITSITTSSVDYLVLTTPLPGFWNAATGEVTVGIEWIETNCLPDQCIDGTFTGGGPAATSLNYSLESITAVPDPSTWALVLIGFAAIGFASYRSRAAGTPGRNFT
jgi:hypothetical protein